MKSKNLSEIPCNSKIRKFEKISNIILAVTGILLFAPAAWATTYSWRGGGGDARWSTAANWSPQGVPTHVDDVVFDEDSSGTIYVDESVELHDNYVAVNSLTITNFTGEIVLNQPFWAIHTYRQSSGTFTCGEHPIRIGKYAYGYGNFYLDGGTFNAPSTEFRHFSSSHQVNMYMQPEAVFNHNGGDFLVEARCGGGHFGLMIHGKTFNNFKLFLPENSSSVTFLINRDLPQGLTATTNTVLGDFSFGAGSFREKDVVWIVKGNVEISGAASGGNAAFLLNSENDQTVTQTDSRGRSCGIIVDKPENAKVYFRGDHEFVFYMNAALSNSGYHGLEWIKGGGIDFSGVPSIYFTTYHTNIHFPPKDKVVMPDFVKIQGYQPIIKAYDLEFKNLKVGTTDGNAQMPENSTNTVLGTLEVTAGGFKPASAYIVVNGDYVVNTNYNVTHARRYGGGTSWIWMKSAEDQRIVLSTNASCNSLLIDKPAGSKVTVEAEDRGILWLGHQDGAIGYRTAEGSLHVKSGILDVSQGGIYHYNGHAGTIKQTGGEILWGPLGLKIHQGNGGHLSNVSFENSRLPRFEVSSAPNGNGSRVNISGDLHVTDMVHNHCSTASGNVYVYGDHTVYADGKAFWSPMYYVGDDDQTLYVEEGNMYGSAKVYVQKTGGTLRLASDVKIGNATNCEFRHDSGNLDMNGHTLTLSGNAHFSGRAVFSGGAGQVRVLTGTFYPKDGATIAFHMPVGEECEPFIYAKNIYFPELNAVCNMTAEVMEKVSRDAKAYARLACATNSISNYAWSGLDTPPVWSYDVPQVVKRPSVSISPSIEGGKVSVDGGTVDFSCRLRFPGFLLLLR